MAEISDTIPQGKLYDPWCGNVDAVIDPILHDERT